MRAKSTRDVDYIAALGIVGIHHRVAASLYRLCYCMDPRGYTSALDEAVRLAKRVNARRSWGLQPKRLSSAAEGALRWLICPVCPDCEGRRWERMPGTGRLRASLCQTCAGSGISRIDTRYVADIAYELERSLREIESSLSVSVRAALR